MSSTPTSWQLIVSLAGVGGFALMLVTLGIVYGKITARLDAVETTQRDSAKHSEMAVMFEDIKRRLERIEDHFDRIKP